MNPKYDIMFNDQEKHVSKESLPMNILTSNAHFRQRVIKRSYRTSVTEASNLAKGNTNR